MIIPRTSTYNLFGERFFNSIDGLNLQMNMYKIRKLNLELLKYRGIKTYADFSRLFHQYIAYVDPMDIYNYWEGITFKEIMNDYMHHIIYLSEMNRNEKTT
jgi:hypothetical protein